jgi:MarR family 2-MHQ and catechol resistance regulon transcriptional repressor
LNKRSSDYGEANNKNLRLVIGLSRSYLKIERATQSMLAEYNITLPQFGVMEALYHIGELKICEIIEKTLSTSGNMTVVIRNLEKASYISRCQSIEDKRASVISLTEKGVRLIEKIFPVNLKITDTMFKNLTDKEKDELTTLLKKMNKVE